VSGFAAGEATDGTAAGANMTGKATGNSRFKKIKLGLLLLSGTLLTQVPSDTITVEKYLDVDLQRHSRRLDREILPVEKRPLENLKRNQSEKNTEAGNVLPDTNEDAFELLLRSLKQYASQLNQTDINEMIIKQKSAKGQSSIRAMRVFLQQEKIPVFVVNTLANWSKLLDAIDEPKGCIGLTCQSPIDGRVVIVVYKGQLDGDVFVHEGTHAAIYVKVRKPMILAGRYIGNVSEILTSNTKDWIRNIQVVHSDFVDKRGHRLTGRARERAFQLYLCENIMQQLKKAAKSGRISGDRFLELNEILAWIYNIAAFPNVKHHIQTRAEREFFKKGRKDPRKDPNYPGPAMKEVMKRLKRPENAKVKDWLVDRFKEIGLPNPWQLSTVPFVGTSVPGRAVGAVTAEAKGGGEANAAAQIEQTAVIGKAAKVETAGVTANAAPSNNTKETFYLQELAKRKALIQGLIDKSSAYRTNNPRGSKPALVKDVITVLQTQAAITQFGVSERYLQTYGAGPCFILAIYDPATKTAALAHIDDKTDVAASIFQMLSKMNLSSRENLQARIIGGYGYSIRSVDDTIGLVNNLRAENIDIVEIGWNESSTDSAAVIIDSETGEVFNMRGAVDHPEFRAAEMIRMLEIQRAGGSKIPARILEAGRFLEYEIVAPVRSSSDELLFVAGGGVGVFGDTAIANGVGAASRATGTQANATSDEQTLSISELNWDDELIKLRELVEEIIAMSDVLDDTALLQIAQKSLQPIQQLLQVLSSQQPSLLSSDETIMPTRNDATPREIMAIFVRVLKLIKGSLKAPADKSNTPTLLKNVDMNTLLPLLKKSLLAIKQSLSQDIEGVNRKKISSAAGATSEARGSRAVGAVSAEAKGGGQTSDNVTGNIESSVTIINEQTRNLGHVEEFRLVAFLKSEQIGAVIYKLFSNSPDTIWISRIYVKEGYRRNGIGQRLLRALLEEARKRGKTKIALLCAKRNVAALRFYRTMAKRFGMQIDEKNVIGFYKITYSRLPKSAGLRAIVGNTSSAAASDRGAGEAAATAASPAEAAPPANEPASAIGKIEMHIVSRNEEAFIRQILSIYPEYAENEVKLTLHAKNIKNGHEALIVAMSKTAKTILGFALCTNEDVGKIYIDLLFTHIGYRRQGVARSLMWYCQRHFTTITLHNEVSDPIIKQAMNNLYFSLGFTNERGNRFLWSRSIAGHVSNALSTALAQGATPALAVATQARVDGESEQSPAEATGIEPTAEELKKIAGQKSVLLIDGQPARRETIRQIIFAMGFYVYVADTPEEAMSKYTGLADLVIDMTDEDITEIERNLQILQGNVIKLQGLDEELLRDKVNEWLIDQWRQTQA
jgi:ribosomal protein S18 acetylase RimI-like enzyme